MQETQLPEHINPSTPLHEILFSWGKRFWSGPVPLPKLVVSQVHDEGSIEQQLQRVTVSHLATALRMSGIEGQDDVMLTTLEGLALAGEITFADYATRVQNLFLRDYARLDVTLRMKVAALSLPHND